MKIRQARFFAAAGSLVAIVALTNMAEAASAYTVGPSKVRSGPGANHPVIGGVLGGSRVTVHECTTGWCRLSAQALHGWMAQSRLEFVQSTPAVQQAPTIQFNFGFGFGGRSGQNAGAPGNRNAGAPGGQPGPHSAMVGQP